MDFSWPGRRDQSEGVWKLPLQQWRGDPAMGVRRSRHRRLPGLVDTERAGRREVESDPDRVCPATRGNPRGLSLRTARVGEGAGIHRVLAHRVPEPPHPADSLARAYPGGAVDGENFFVSTPAVALARTCLKRTLRKPNSLIDLLFHLALASVEPGSNKPSRRRAISGWHAGIARGGSFL